MSKQSIRPDRYALVGHPVHHSRSPLIHQLFAKQTGELLTYELLDVAADEFEVAVRGFRAAGGKGLNVTVPYKQAAYELAEIHGPEAERAKAVNTLSFDDGPIRGDNTDGIGFIRDLTVNQQIELAGSRLLVLGAGGAARGIIGPLIDAGPDELWIANRTTDRAEQLKSEQQAGADTEINICTFDALDAIPPFEIVVNATSAGLAGEQPPFPASLIDDNSFCYDLVYSLKDTPFVTWARSHGARKAVQGWGMLVEQAAESYRIWRGKRPDTSEILQKLLR
jgi:shikimate dehydrogenase